jgi:transcriptional regulator with XRE-family HTH domain
MNMLFKKSAGRRQVVLFEQQQTVLTKLGENIRLARKRRHYTQQLICDRIGLSRTTIRRIEQGDPGVSIGHYMAVLSVLDLMEDLGKVALADPVGRELQDIELLAKRARRSVR